MIFLPFTIEQSAGLVEVLVQDTKNTIHTFTKVDELHSFLVNNDAILAGFRPNRDLIKRMDLEVWCNWCDLAQDMDDMLTLDAIMAHIGLPFEKMRDVEKVSVLLIHRSDYLDNKVSLALVDKQHPIDPAKCLSMTEPQLMAELLGASARGGLDESFDTPDCIDWQLIPPKVTNLFSNGANGTCECEIGGLSVSYGQGGIHGAIPKYQAKATDTHKLWLVDVASMYPSMMIEYGYVSRAVKDPSAFKTLLEKRIEYKRTEPTLAGALKGPLNKTYGAMRSKYNALYDPTMAFAVCIAGQLVMTMLLRKLSLINDLKLVQVNTDGVLIEFDTNVIHQVTEVLSDWQNKTHLKLETTELADITQKDVSNYIANNLHNEPKLKGAVFARGISEIGAWKINNNMLVVSDAVTRYFTAGVEPEVTINECDAPVMFQIITNVSDKYDTVIHETIKGDTTLGKVNRVFATKDHKLGSLKKIKGKGKTKEQIPNLPVHCVVCNSLNDVNMADIDKEFYIEHAKKLINSFGCKPIKKVRLKPKMTSKTDGLNVYQKLALARTKFLEAAPKKTGWNKYLEFAYYQLEDIVPTQLKVFAEVGLMEEFTYHAPVTLTHPETGEWETKTLPALGVSKIINIDNPEDTITFQNLWVDSEVKGQSAIQAYGSIQTYLRRYNKMQILDLVEYDEMDATVGKDGDGKDAESKPKAQKKPVSANKRAEIKKSLTGTDKPADDVLIGQIKNAMATLKKEFAERQEYKDWVKDAPKPKDLQAFTQAQAKEFLHKAGELREQLTKGE